MVSYQSYHMYESVVGVWGKFDGIVNFGLWRGWGAYAFFSFFPKIKEAGGRWGKEKGVLCSWIDWEIFSFGRREWDNYITGRRVEGGGALWYVCRLGEGLGFCFRMGVMMDPYNTYL